MLKRSLFRSPSSLAHLFALVGVVAGILLAGPVRAGDTTPAQQLDRFVAQAGVPANADRGKAFFNARHGGEWSCSSCHGNPPVKTGQHASTGKEIASLAPAFNAKTFIDSARVDKWFRRNCNDVLSHECSATEKADVLAWLISLKP
ncbi:MAG: DUF1924 domain-containing protein [Burkholderiaceae bacterium]